MRKLARHRTAPEEHSVKAEDERRQRLSIRTPSLPWLYFVTALGHRRDVTLSCMR